MERQNNGMGKLVAMRRFHVPHRSSRRIAFTVFYSFLLIQRGWAASSLQSQEPQAPSTPEEVEYNASFIHGEGVDVSQYEKGNPISPGKYTASVVVNGKKRGKHDIVFAVVEGEKSARACFVPDDLSALGIRVEGGESTGAETCTPIENIIPGAIAVYNSGDFELNITVPQAYLVPLPRGYVDPKRWESGDAVAFADYNANVYDASSGDQDRYSGNIGLMLGLNAGEWRLRKRLNTSWVKGEGTRTQNLFGYAERDLTAMRSRLTIGDTVTAGELFDSYGLRGAQVRSDNRMLPEGLRNYSPIIQGVAESNARITITQHGQTVYETVVPAGPFKLEDVGVMGYGGDLEMTITEADGRQRKQTIPFSAPPMLLHQGVSYFTASVGELHDATIRAKSKILQGTYYYGIGNSYTVYAGVQIAENYKSAAVGNSINTLLGGLSFDITHSQNKLPNNKQVSGNSVSAGYSKYLSQTDTNLALAAYRYSNEGFYTFRDANIARSGDSRSREIVDYRTKQQFTATIAQQLWANSTLTLSASLYNYWHDRGTGKQYSLSYSKSQRYFTWSLSAARARMGTGDYNDSITLGVNVPFAGLLTSQPLFSSIYSSFSHDSDGHDSFQLSANGSRGEQSELTYGIGTAASGVHGSGGRESVYGNMHYRSPVGQFGLTASANNTSSRQLSASASGSLVAHRGGVTAGPQLGESPFAIIHAEGAKGARVMNGSGTRIDRNGYALIPSLTPYRENTVTLDTKGLPDDVDVLENQKEVVPRMGAALSVEMKTITGKPVIIIARDQNNEYLPIGTMLVDDNNVTQSVIGQGGMAFVRGWDPLAQSLFAVLNAGKTRCRLSDSRTHASLVSANSGVIEQREMTCVYSN